MTTPYDMSEADYQAEIANLRSQVERLHADGAVMRGVQEWILDGLQKNALDAIPVKESLSANAGRDLLARYREAVDLVKCCREALKHERVFLEDYLKSHTHPGVSRLVGDNRGAVQWADTLLAIVKVSNLVRGGE